MLSLMLKEPDADRARGADALLTLVLTLIGIPHYVRATPRMLYQRRLRPFDIK